MIFNNNIFVIKINFIILLFIFKYRFMKSFEKCQTDAEIEKFFSDMVTDNLPKRKKITKVMAKKLHKLYLSKNY